jgi:hypothetical protein
MPIPKTTRKFSGSAGAILAGGSQDQFQSSMPAKCGFAQRPKDRRCGLHPLSTRMARGWEKRLPPPVPAQFNKHGPGYGILKCERLRNPFNAIEPVGFRLARTPKNRGCGREYLGRKVERLGTIEVGIDEPAAPPPVITPTLHGSRKYMGTSTSVICVFCQFRS